jgi:hypothetical protein
VSDAQREGLKKDGDDRVWVDCAVERMFAEVKGRPPAGSKDWFRVVLCFLFETCISAARGLDPGSGYVHLSQALL